MILVIPTAGLATRMQPLSCGLPKVLVAHHDRPLIDHILACYSQISLEKVIVVIAPGQHALFEPVLAAYQLRYHFELVVQAQPKGLLNAVLLALKRITKPTSVMVHLADAIFEQPFRANDFKQSFVTLTKVSAQQVKQWCMVGIKKRIVYKFEDKPHRSKLRTAITGTYYFSQWQVLQQAIALVQADAAAIKQGDISALLGLYARACPLYAYYRKDWRDMGTLSNMHQHLFRHDLDGHQVLQSGQFIYKSGRSLAMKNEQFYYSHYLTSACFPRIHTLKSNSIKMDYIPAHSLAYYFLWHAIPNESRTYIIHAFWRWMEQNFYHYRCSRVGYDYQAQTANMYGERIVHRVESWQKGLSAKDQKHLLNDRIIVNGQSLKSWGEIKQLIYDRAQILAKSVRMKHIHGDLHARNILYSPEYNTFYLVDPRGAWGNEHSIWGDIRYDAAKFLHSFHGSYEFIKNRLSLYEELDNGSYLLQMPLTRLGEAQWLDYFCQQWRVAKNDVLWIEALCLLSISKFYRDPALQKQFFLQGLILLNSLL